MKSYCGIRKPDADFNSPGDVLVLVDGRPLPAVPSQKLWNHSPDGFEWGYGGSGPAQLALALLLDVLGDPQRAIRLHQRFKFRVVGAFPREGWDMTEEEIKTVVRELEAE